MDAVDPLCASSSPTRLLPRTLGPAPARSPAASPPKAREALLEVISRPLIGSEEVVKQARMTSKEYGDIQMLYNDDGRKDAPLANRKKEQQGKRPGPDRRRGRFTMKENMSQQVPVIDRSKLAKTSDPLEYFTTLDRIEEAEKEVKRLNGEDPDEITLNFEPVDALKRRPGLPGRKSTRTFKLIDDDDDTQHPIEVPPSQTGTMTESQSQLSQDGTRAAMDKNEPSIPSRSDSLPEKDDGDELTYLLTSLRNLDQSEEEDFIRKTLGIQEIRKQRVSLRNSIPGDRSTRNNTVAKSPMRVCTPERPVPQGQSLIDRISELEKHLFPADIVNDECTGLLNDDESEGSPDIVMGEPSLMHDSSEVLMTDEIFTASEVDRGTLNLGARAAENVLDPGQNIPECADEMQAGGSPLGLFKDAEVANEKFPCGSNNISKEEHPVPINYPTVGGSNNNETEVSSHNLEDSSTEVLVSTPGSKIAPDGTDRMPDAAEENIQHLEVVEEDGVLQDKSSHLSEIPREGTNPLDQSQMHGGNIENLEADMRNSLPPTKPKKQLAAQKRKRKQQSNRGQKVSAESSLQLETTRENFDSENQPHTNDVNIEQRTVVSNALSPNEAKGQKVAQRNKTKNLNRRESLADAGLAWQSGMRKSTRIRSRPLKHWLGERFLYGRIHDTMTTVIGVKAYSPGQDGKETLKVKSFVHEQYSDIVAESAKY